MRHAGSLSPWLPWEALSWARCWLRSWCKPLLSQVAQPAHAPRWLPIPLAALGGFVLGALLVALLVQATPVASSTASVNGEPVVHMGVSNFAQPGVTVPKGSKLKLIDDGSYLHILNNGNWENNTPHPAAEAGAPAVRNVQVNGNSVEIGPFNTAGTFHIYCTIHPGMNLTVIVQ